VSSEATVAASPAPTPKTPKTRKPKRSLKPRQKEQACALFGAGESIDELAKKFDVSVKSLRNLFAARGIKRGELADKVKEEAKKELEKLVREQAATLAGQAYATKDELHKLIRFYTKMIGKIGMDAHTGGQDLSIKLNTIRACREAIAALKLAQESQFPLLGIKEDEVNPADDIPELPLVTLTDEEIRRMQAERTSELGDIGGIDAGLQKLDEDMKKAGNAS
jgi:Mor family transcriptional regulator